MRAFAAVVAVAATLALAGCAGSQEPHSPIDPEEAEAADYRMGAIVAGILAIAVPLFVGVLFLVRRRRRQRAARAGTVPTSAKKT